MGNYYSKGCCLLRISTLERERSARFWTELGILCSFLLYPGQTSVEDALFILLFLISIPSLKHPFIFQINPSFFHIERHTTNPASSFPSTEQACFFRFFLSIPFIHSPIHPSILFYFLTSLPNIWENSPSLSAYYCLCFLTSHPFTEI